MTAKRLADPAAAGTAAPATKPATHMQTSAPSCKPAKPAHHQPSARPPRDAFTGQGGSYMRDPATGQRTPAPPAAPAAGTDPAAAQATAL